MCCFKYLISVLNRLKPVHKVEGMTNGTASGVGQQQQQQQGSGHVDISTQVQQYQQFLGGFLVLLAVNRYQNKGFIITVMRVMLRINHYLLGWWHHSEIIIYGPNLLLMCFFFGVSIYCVLSPDASRALPEFPDIDLEGKSLPEGIELDHIKSFQLLYREHCEVSKWQDSGWMAETYSVFLKFTIGVVRRTVEDYFE